MSLVTFASLVIKPVVKAIVSIIIVASSVGGLLILLILIYLMMFYVFNKWVIENGKNIRVIQLSKARITNIIVIRLRLLQVLALSQEMSSSLLMVTVRLEPS